MGSYFVIRFDKMKVYLFEICFDNNLRFNTPIILMYNLWKHLYDMNLMVSIVSEGNVYMK